MGWFDELIKERKQKNQDIFDSSFNSLSDQVFKGRQDEEPPLHAALRQIFGYYHVDCLNIPDRLVDASHDLDILLNKYSLRTSHISIEGLFEKEYPEPILAFTKDEKVPVAIFPNGNGRFYLINPKTGRKVRLSKEIFEKFDADAITFYRLFARPKPTFSYYLQHIKNHVRKRDLILMVFLIVVVMAVSLASPYCTKILLGDVIDHQDYGLFLTMIFVTTGVALAGVLIKTTQQIVNARVLIKIEKSVHSSLMLRLLSLPTSFFQKFNTGELTTRVDSVTELCKLLVEGVFIGGLTSLMSLAFVFQIASFSISLILPTVAVVVANLVFMILMAFIEGNVMDKQMKLGAKENGVSYDLIRGIQKIRLTGTEKRAYAKWATYYGPYARITYQPPIIIRLSPVISGLISSIGIILVYLFAGRANIDKSTYAAFASAYGSLTAALVALNLILSNAMKVRPLINMIMPLLAEEPENDQRKDIVDHLNGDIRFEHVSFRYNEDQTLVLNDLSLNIRSGEYVALVGKTGCGKSTIVRLLLGFEKPLEGDVYYDDRNINELDLPSLRKKIGSVTQNGTLMHADILHNITISAPELGEDEAWEAARIANVARDIKRMPMGMHTVISEGQGSISGGQKQRIMIARAVVHKPKILIFDEATSALDNRCQKEVTEAIGKLDCTRIVIAHRLSTIKDCDRILYLEGGKVVEEGTYDELVALDGKFKELIERQKVE